MSTERRHLQRKRDVIDRIKQKSRIECGPDVVCVLSEIAAHWSSACKLYADLLLKEFLRAHPEFALEAIEIRGAVHDRKIKGLPGLVYSPA